MRIDRYWRAHWPIDQIRIEGTLATDIKVVNLHEGEHLFVNGNVVCNHDHTAKRATVPTTTPYTCNSSFSLKRMGG